MEDVYSLIRQDILNKEQVVATYDGYQREMCLYVIGTKDGNNQALFYQFGRSSRSGLSPVGSENNWRCIPISGLSNVSLRKGEWFTAANFSRRQHCIDSIGAEVKI
ncbi:MAG: hypothetical protein EXR59_02980 [Dehalococcoidia bacterium]|nr:hypothetical protein [Dehalococcoidia bacterium]